MRLWGNKKNNPIEANAKIIIVHMRKFLKAESENEKLDNLDSVLGHLNYIFELMSLEIESKEPTVFAWAILEKSGRITNRFLTFFNKFKNAEEYDGFVRLVIENIRVAFYCARKNLRAKNDAQFYGSK